LQAKGGPGKPDDRRVSQISNCDWELVEVLFDRTALLAFAAADGAANFRSRREVPVPSLEPARNGPISAPSRYAAAVPSW